MALVAENASETIQLKHHYTADRDQVFAAWTDPKALGQWFGPHSHSCHIEKWDLREGGEYQIRMIPVGEDSDCGGDSDKDSVCAGKFVQVQPPGKLVMTFTWIENGGDIGETLLTIELFEAGDGTDVVLTHERLPDEEMRKAHTGGWQGTLECLEEYLQR